MAEVCSYLLLFVYLMGMAARFPDLRDILNAYASGLLRDVLLIVFCLIWPITMLSNVIATAVKKYLEWQART